MTQAFAMIMAGGASENLSVLTEVRAEPAIPFGGKFCLIDFPLSNCVNSEIYNVAVLTQYRPHALNAHIGIGKPWDLDRASGGVRLLQPYQGGPYGDWQRGTADAVRRNLDFVQEQQEEHVLILAGDHIYLMDYRPMLAQHISANRIVNFQEKPQQTRETLASMGIYIFRKSVLIQLLTQNSSYVDFGRDVLPGMLHQRAAIHAYQFSGYWADVGTPQAYWEANMSLLAENPSLDLYDPDWVVHTRSQERAPVKIGPNAQVSGNLLSNGCQIDGVVERSVLSPGVYVAEGAAVRDSILLRDTIVESGAVVDRAILDRGVVVGSQAKVGYGDDNQPNGALPAQLNTGLTLIGRRSQIPEGVTLGRNVVVHPESGAEVFGEEKQFSSGGDIR